MGSNSTIQYINCNTNNYPEKNQINNSNFDKNIFMGLNKNNNSVNRIDYPNIGNLSY
jgi:hypothetical protein